VLLVSCFVTLATGAARGEPVRAAVRSWVSPVAGANPFTPGPGDLVPDATFDLNPGVEQMLAGFHPSDAWITPSATPPAEATLVQREYSFVYTVEVTDLGSNGVGTIDLPGTAFASWVERSDGTIFQQQLGVDLGDPSGELVLGGNRYRLGQMVYMTGPTPLARTKAGFDLGSDLELQTGADVMLSVTAAPGVPEPTTLLLAAGGLGAMGLGAWRRKSARRSS
jgi:hypothetical protein